MTSYQQRKKEKDLQKVADEICRMVKHTPGGGGPPPARGEPTGPMYFTREEVLKVLRSCDMYVAKSKNPSKGLDRNSFRELLHDKFKMSDDVIMDRVFRAFDTDNDAFVSHRELISGLSVFIRGQVREKADYCFNVYDMNSDGYISREEMFQFLKNCFYKQQSLEEDPDEAIKELLDICMRKMDYDKDNRLSREDFHKAIAEEPLLLEFLGSCIPDEHCLNCYCEDTLGYSQLELPQGWDNMQAAKS